MKLNEKLASENNVEKLKTPNGFWAWLLPEDQRSRKMVAYAHDKGWIWIHPDYLNGQDNKKKDKRAKEETQA